MSRVGFTRREGASGIGRHAKLPADRWTTKLLEWSPALHFEGLKGQYARRQARPKVRWDDELTVFVHFVAEIHEPWIHVARNSEMWAQLADDFVQDQWRRAGE